MKYIFLLISLCLFSLTSGYLQRIPQMSPKVYESRKQTGNFQLLKTNINKSNLITRQLFLAPQIAFAASCAFAVFSYVYFNIDSIKEKQKIAVEKTMSEQSQALRSAENTQRLAIENARKLQNEALERSKRIAEEARLNAERIAEQQRRR